MLSSNSNSNNVDVDGVDSALALAASLRAALEEARKRSSQGVVAAEHWNSPARRDEIRDNVRQQKEAREASNAARKHLTDVTKQLKKAVKALEQQQQQAVAASSASGGNDDDDDDAVLLAKAVEAAGKQSRATVKSYQEEIDNLTRRCKFAEGAYQDVAKSLLEFVPLSDDNDEVLENAAKIVEQLSEALEKEKEKGSSGGGGGGGAGMSNDERDELVRLRREVSEYEVEFRGLKNQDITIRKLESKINELQNDARAEMQEQLAKAKEELAETEGRRVAEALEREAALERKLQQLQLQLTAERAGNQATESAFLDSTDEVSHREAAWEAQKRILVDDADRLRENLQVATRERDELRLRVAAVEGGANTAGGGRRGGDGIASMATTTSAPPSSGAGGVVAASVADLMLERKAYEAEVRYTSKAIAHS